MSSAAFCPPTISPEYLKLLHFSRISDGDHTDVTEEEVTILTSAVNALPNMLGATRALLPLIYRRVIKNGIFDDLDNAVQDVLKQGALNLVATEMLYQRWLCSAFEIFEQHGFKIILLKGAAFSNNLYTPAAPRPGADLDLLVKASDFDKVCGLLADTMEPVLMAASRTVTHATLFERMFVPKKGEAPIVEIHRGLTNPHIFTINEESLWSASRQHPEYQREYVRVLSPEDTLLHLATHAFRDLDFCAHNLLDAHEIICQNHIDTQLLLRRASDWGARSVLYYLLYNTHMLMDTPIERGLLAALKPGNVNDHINRAILRYSSPQNLSDPLKYRLTQLVSQFSFPDRLSNTLRFQAQYAITRVKDFLTH